MEISKVRRDVYVAQTPPGWDYVRGFATARFYKDDRSTYAAILDGTYEEANSTTLFMKESEIIKTADYLGVPPCIPSPHGCVRGYGFKLDPEVWVTVERKWRSDQEGEGEGEGEGDWHYP